ncbi:hypothetical protein [Alkalihalobacterium chitinilyticum]|uniref:Lipoprotein n=1 Tax=Alkalihalobacterium chitinilyticum TaxID=2980103 RepID=A0ABT5VDD2_9BACI|nr:hypothetical protein [Alkalihalobacterium chitinilyticum]MDE5413448.1 hypothetical protein [Alkalihalobacterium chitinilyticum]
MKRLFLLFLLCATVFLAACTTEPSNEGATNQQGNKEQSREEQRTAVIKNGELTRFEEGLLQSIGDRAFVYDIDIENVDVSEIYVTVDHYTKGELVSKVVEMTTPIYENSDDNVIRTVFINQQFEKMKKERWTLSVMTNSETTHGSIDKELSLHEDHSLSAYGGITDPVFLSLNEKYAVASVIRSNEDAITVINGPLTEEELKEVTNYDHVYIVSIQLN